MSEKKKNFRLPGCFATPDTYDHAIIYEKIFEKMSGCGSAFVKKIKKVVYAKPVTVVFWSDDTTTKCRCSEQDNYDVEKGLLICIMKKLYGNDEVRETLDKWTPVSELLPEETHKEITLKDVRKRVKEGE